MKLYWGLIFPFVNVWLAISTLYSEPIWWSLYSSARSTHTPKIEQLSIIKLTMAGLISLGVWALLKSRLT